MTYFIKKLGHQELGSTSNTDKASRGKYIYISKTKSVLDFFPPLSKDIKNDKTLIKIRPIYQNTGEIRECNYVYNNDKFHSNDGKGRNEYRFYLKKLLENDSIKIEVEDILIMRDFISQTSDSLNQNKIYLIDIVKPKDQDYYRFCQEIISDHSIGKNKSTALYEGNINFFDAKLNKTDNLKHSQPLDHQLTFNHHPMSEDALILEKAQCCQLTGTIIAAGSITNLNIYPINPYDVGSLFNNALVFSKDIGWAFTKGLFTVRDDLTIVVHPDVNNSILTLYHGKKLGFDDLPNLIPSKDNLGYHRENIFGGFKKSN